MLVKKAKHISVQCSVGLMSELCAGHLCSFTHALANHVFMELVLCLEAVSGLNRFRPVKSNCNATALQLKKDFQDNGVLLTCLVTDQGRIAFISVLV